MTLTRALEGAKCKMCEGTGWQYLLKTWFHVDGYRKERCGICAGTGISNYKPSGSEVQQARRLRVAAELAALRARFPTKFAKEKDNGCYS